MSNLVINLIFYSGSLGCWMMRVTTVEQLRLIQIIITEEQVNQHLATQGPWVITVLGMLILHLQEQELHM